MTRLPVARVRASWWRRLAAWFSLPPLPFVPLVLAGFPIDQGPPAPQRGYEILLDLVRDVRQQRALERAGRSAPCARCGAPRYPALPSGFVSGPACMGQEADGTCHRLHLVSS